MRLVLASASPQRRALLAEAGFAFDSVEARVEELAEGMPPAELAATNARLKAEYVARQGFAEVVIGSDTVVALGDEPYGKPESEAEARGMIARLAGRWHEVHTAVCVVEPNGTRCETDTTRVRFRTLTSDEIAENVSLGEWRGRAGGYAIQESGRALVAEIEGDEQTVIGFPVSLVERLLPVGVQPPRPG